VTVAAVTMTTMTVSAVTMRTMTVTAVSTGAHYFRGNFAPPGS
jgi:hypothetical protein